MTRTGFLSELKESGLANDFANNTIAMRINDIWFIINADNDFHNFDSVEISDDYVSIYKGCECLVAIVFEDISNILFNRITK